MTFNIRKTLRPDELYNNFLDCIKTGDLEGAGAYASGLETLFNNGHICPTKLRKITCRTEDDLATVFGLIDSILTQIINNK